MSTNLSRKIIPGAITIVVVSLLGYWYFLNFAPPYNVSITDATDTSVAVIWSTKTATSSTIYFSSDSRLITTLPLSLPLVGRRSSPGKTTNHRLVISHLMPDTTYYFAIANDVHVYHVYWFRPTSLDPRKKEKIIQSPFPKIKTRSKNAISGQVNEIRGVVRNRQLRAITDALVIAQYGSRDTAMSTLTDRSGAFRIRMPHTNEASAFFTVYDGPFRQVTTAFFWQLKEHLLIITLP